MLVCCLYITDEGEDFHSRNKIVRFKVFAFIGKRYACAATGHVQKGLDFLLVQWL